MHDRYGELQRTPESWRPCSCTGRSVAAQTAFVPLTGVRTQLGLLWAPKTSHAGAEHCPGYVMIIT